MRVVVSAGRGTRKRREGQSERVRDESFMPNARENEMLAGVRVRLVEQV